MAAPVIEAADITESGNSTAEVTAAVTYPAYASGDLVIICFGSDGATTHTLPSTGPNGETIVAIQADNVSPAQCGQSSFYWIGNSSQSSGTISVTQSASQEWQAAAILVPSGEFDATTPIDSSSTATSNAQEAATPSWSVTNANCRVVQFITSDVRQVISSVTGYTIRANTDNGPLALCIATRDSGTSSSETISAEAFTLDSTGDGAAATGFAVNEPQTSAFTSTVAATAPAVTSSVSASHAVPAFTSTVDAEIPAVASAVAASHAVPAFTSTVSASCPAVTSAISASHTTNATLPVDIATDAGETVYAAYSVCRKVADAYSGDLLLVRRDSDNTTTGIGFDGNGDLDTTALLAFVGAGNGYIQTIYDQSGNGDNITQATESLQPQIVSSGSVMTNINGNPIADFVDDELAVTLSSSVSNIDVLVMVMLEAHENPSTTQQRIVTFGESPFTHKLEFSIGESEFPWIKFGTGGAVSSSILGGRSLMFWPSIQSLKITSSDVSAYRNLYEYRTQAHASTGTSQTKLRIGSGTQAGMKFSELIITTAPATIDTIYQSLNSYYATGPAPSDINSPKLFAQRWKWQCEYYDYLESFGTDSSSFDVTPAAMTWDETYADVAELSNIHLLFHGLRSQWTSVETNHRIARAASKWFILDDGAGAGIEATGSIRCPKMEGSRPAEASAICAMLYQLSLPLTPSGNGNPYYQESGLAYRGIVSALVHQMVMDAGEDESDYFYFRGFMVGGRLLGGVWALRVFWDTLSAGMKQTVKDFIRFKVYKLRRILPGIVDQRFGNMHMKTAAALVHCWHLLDGDTQGQTWCIEAAKRLFFGAVDGTTGGTSKGDGMWAPGGYIVEGDGADTTYHGESLLQLHEALAESSTGSGDWSFLLEICKAATKFKAYQHFPDPDDRYEGPSAYAVRTADSAVYDNGTSETRELTSAASYSEGRWLARNYRVGNSSRLSSEATMVSDITGSLSYWNGRGIDDAYVGTPFLVASNQDAHWPLDNYYEPPSGWYASLSSLITSDDDTTHVPWDLAATFNVSFGDEFWAYKDTDGSEEFGWFVESSDYNGIWDGYYGGSVQTFWTRSGGIFLLARHGLDRPDWASVRTWPIHHIRGRDDAATGTYFGTGHNNTTTFEKTSTFNLAGSPPTVTFTCEIGNATGTSKGQQTGTELDGEYDLQVEFEALSNGLSVTHTITRVSGSDNVSELVCTLPVYLGDPSQAVADTTIEYWTGSAWASLTTAFTSTTKLRLMRNFGTPAYCYVFLDITRNVRISDAVWQQDYQADTRIRNIEIDMHGNTGTDIELTSRSVQFNISTEDANAWTSTVAATTPAVTSAASATNTPPEAFAAVAATVPAVTSASSAAHTVPGWSGWTIATTPAVTASVSASHVPANWDAAVAVTTSAVTSAAVAEATTTPEDYTATVACTLPAVVAEINARKGSRRKRPTIINKQRGATINGEWL